jgi:hypothetical protein
MRRDSCRLLIGCRPYGAEPQQSCHPKAYSKRSKVVKKLRHNAFFPTFLEISCGNGHVVYVTSGGCNGFNFDGVFYRRMIQLTAPPFPKGISPPSQSGTKKTAPSNESGRFEL